MTFRGPFTMSVIFFPNFSERMYFFTLFTLFTVDELKLISFVQGKSGRKTETQSHKAKTLALMRVMLVEPPKAGGQCGAQT